MTVPEFRELLSLTSETVERPRALAAGHYIGVIRNHEFGVSRKQTPLVRYFLTPLEEGSDVQPGENDGIDLSKRELRKDFYITHSAMYRLMDMLDAVLGQQRGRPADARIPDTRGVRVMFQVTQRAVQDDAGNVTEVFNDVGTIVAAD